VPERNNPDDPEFEKASSTLNEGLKSCRAVVRNYRALFSEESSAPAEQPECDQAEGASNDS
jgi:hypothetical protein